MIREKGRREEGIDGNLRRAAHKGRQENGHFPIPVRGQCPGCHDAGNRTAEADEHGHDAAAGQANLPQQLIHDKGHPGHITAVLQDGKEEKQGHDHRQKAQDAAYAIENAINDQGMNHRIDAKGGEPVVHQCGQSLDAQLQHFRQPGADNAKGQPEHQAHDGHKGRNGRIFARQEPVQLLAADMALALPGLHHSLGAHALNELIAHICHGSRPVQAALLLHLPDDVFQHLLLVLIQLQAAQDVLISFCQLAGSEPAGNPGIAGVVIDQVHDAMETPVHGTIVIQSIAEVLTARTLLVAGHMDSMIHQLADALALQSGDWHHGDPQPLFQFVDQHGAAVFPDLVHHIQGQNHGNVQLHQLHGQIEVALNVGRVHNIDDASGLLLQNELAGHQLLTGVGRHGIDSGKIRHQGVLLTADDTVLAIHGDTGEIAHMLVGAGQLVKQSCLAAVLVSCQGKRQGLPFRQCHPV